MLAFARVPFGVGKFRRLLVAASFSCFAQFLMGFLGSVLSGRFLGPDALAGVSLQLSVSSFLGFIAALFGIGTAIAYSLALGRGERERAWALFSQGFWCVLIVGAFLSLAFYLGYPAWLDFLNPDASVKAAARDYCRWYAFVPFVQLLATFLLNASYADGDDLLCYIGYVTQLAVNLVVSYAFIRLGYGTAACAWGILAGFAATVLVHALHFLRRTNSFRLVRHFAWRDAWTLLKTDFGDASGYLFQAALAFFLETYVIGRYGSAMLPVLAVVIGTMGLLDVFGGVGAAAQPIVSVYVGEGNVRGVREVMRDALRLAIFEGLLASALVAAFPQAVVAIVGIDDPTLVALACRAIRLYAIAFVWMSLANLLNGYYIVIGRGVLSTLLSCVSWFVVPSLLTLVLGSLGLGGVWTALGLGPLVAFAALALYETVRYGRVMFPLLLERDREAKTAAWSIFLSERPIVAVASAVADQLKALGADSRLLVRARLLVEETLMVVKDRNANRRVKAEITLDWNDGIRLTLRDDGEIFDITDADAKISSLRTFLLCSVMERQTNRCNLLTTGYNRNVFNLATTPH